MLGISYKKSTSQKEEQQKSVSEFWRAPHRKKAKKKGERAGRDLMGIIPLPATGSRLKAAKKWAKCSRPKGSYSWGAGGGIPPGFGGVVGVGVGGSGSTTSCISEMSCHVAGSATWTIHTNFVL